MSERVSDDRNSVVFSGKHDERANLEQIATYSFGVANFANFPASIVTASPN